MSDLTPFTSLLSLAVRSQEIAEELPSKENTQLHWAGLGFNLLGQRFVVPLNEVAETMRVPQATLLPGVKDFVVGIGNVRGKLMAVLDLAVFFGKVSDFPRNQRRVIAVEDEDQYFGFIIDESLGMQHFPSDTFETAIDDIDEMFIPYIRGSYCVAGIHWPVLSLTALAEHPELEKLAMVS
ncbi:MAG: chemotaxis protein CheW [Gammaproteobacteria bacterium]|jgi:twitching motility protein PilI|nr:chemotaxis protein CheW [Gammaproteobacteria bacterium]